MVKHAVILAALLTLAAPAGADELRVDLFDRKGQRDGYVIVNRETGRLDMYDRESRRRGYGRVGRDGTVELFDTKSRRLDTAGRMQIERPRR